jgi:aldehyde:ferredoxin oxidoreductase
MQNIILLSKALSWKEIISIGEFVYGSPKASDPDSGYEFKIEPAIWHQHESILKDSLALCDQSWPKLYSFKTDDRYARVTVPQYGTIEGKAFEAYLYNMVTGTEINENELRKRTEAIFNLERALQVRNYGRSRKDDLAIIPYFETPENIIGPSGKRESLDREKFIRLMDKYYQLRGWDPENGWPTEAKLKELGLADVAWELGNLHKDSDT